MHNIIAFFFGGGGGKGVNEKNVLNRKEIIKIKNKIKQKTK